MTAAETKEVLRYLLIMCPRAAPEVTKELARAWCQTLAPFGFGEVSASARRYAARKDFFPRAAELTADLSLRGTDDPPPGREDLERMRRLRERIRAGASGKGKR